jgi:ligand-binding SRPBCC domain-containing protein
MYVIKDSVHIMAPIERCFLLSTSVDLVARSMGIRAVRGKTSGLVEAGDRVEWRGWMLGLPHRHESVITKYDRPRYFQDSMARGRFRALLYDHEFTEIGGQVLLKDTVRFSLPLGAAGRLVGKYVVMPQIRGLMARRFALLKRVAESEEWRQYL